MRGLPAPLLTTLSPAPGDALVRRAIRRGPRRVAACVLRIEGLGYGGAYVAKVDGSTVRRLSPSALQASSPAWSPDGKWIALVRDRVLDWGYPGDIWIVRSDGTGLRRLTNTKRIDERNLTWLPTEN